MQPIVGRHISSTGTIDLTVDLAKQTSCNTMQIFVSSPMQWKVRKLNQIESSKLKEKSKTLQVDPIVVHMPYLANLASPNADIYAKSRMALLSNMENCNQIGAKFLVMHLGSTMGKPKVEAIKRISDAINSCIDNFNGMLLLEDQSGQKNSVGSDLDDLSSLYDNISHKKVGYCIDTCHAFGAGYDIREEEVIDQIDDILDWKKVHVIHANDSKFDLGQFKDRHANIGNGCIGIKGFRTFLNHRKVLGKPIIMETPTDRKSPDKNEIELVRSIID